MSKHTPGPWTVQEREHSFRVVDHRALKFDNSRLCDVQHWSGSTRGPDRAESRANARLIAAAPDLLECLTLALEMLEVDRVTLRECHTGPDGHIDPHDADMCDELDEVADRFRAAIAKATGGEA